MVDLRPLLQYILDRLKEKSTVAGLVALAIAITHASLPDGISQSVTDLVVSLAGLVSVILPEKK